MTEKTESRIMSTITKYSNIALNALFIFFIIILIVISLSYLPSLDSTQKVFSIIGSLSLAVAVAGYYYKKRQDETLATIDQITFFRKEIIPEWKKTIDLISIKNSYRATRIKLDENTIEFAKSKYSKNFKEQISYFFDPTLEEEKDWINSSVLDQHVTLLNLLEEFSLKVQHFKTENHPALTSLHGVFVELIEKNAVAILFMREVSVGRPIYSSTLLLYSKWKDLVEKTNFFNNLRKTGFLGEEQFQAILQKQRDRKE